MTVDESTTAAGEVALGNQSPAERSVEQNCVPLGKKISWAIGSISEQGLSYVIMGLALPIYNIGLGVSATWIMVALAVPRFFDAFTDPWIGNLSDNTRTRWGRRRPHIVGGVIVTTVAFALVWLPPTSLSKVGLFVYFQGLTLIMFLAFGFFSIPYMALGFELSPNSAERTRIMALRNIFTGVFALALPWFYWLCMRPVFENEVVGMRYVGTGAAILFLVCGLTPAVFNRERTPPKAQPKLHFLHTIRTIATNRRFLVLAGIMICVLIGTFIIAPMLLYILIYHICQGDKDYASLINGPTGMTYAIAVIVFAPVFAAVGNRIGKRLMMGLAIGASIIGYFSTWFFFTPANPWLTLVPLPLMTLGGLAIGLLLPAMVADLCDIDELESGFRREGMFSAGTQFLQKFAVAGTTLVAGALLNLSGYVTGEDPTPETLFRMRLLYILFPVALMLIALVLTWRYPVTEKIVEETRRALEARKAAKNGADD